jgi:hypothetical protein
MVILDSVGWAKARRVAYPRGQDRVHAVPTVNVTAGDFAHPTGLHDGSEQTLIRL